MEPKTKKKYTVNMDISKVEKAKELLGSGKSLGELFDDVLSKVIELKEGGGEKIELDSSKIFDFNTLKDTIVKQSLMIVKLTNEFTEVIKRKSDPLYDYFLEDNWSIIRFHPKTSRVNDYRVYATLDQIETHSNKIYIVIKILKTNKLEVIQYPKCAESKRITIDLSVENSTDKVNGYDMISLLWRK